MTRRYCDGSRGRGAWRRRRPRCLARGTRSTRSWRASSRPPRLHAERAPRAGRRCSSAARARAPRGRWARAPARKGAPRPRGFTADSGGPAPAARVGVSALPAALAARRSRAAGALTLAPGRGAAVGAGEGRAEGRRCSEKSRQRGPSALASGRRSGRDRRGLRSHRGGLVTRDDLDAVLPVISRREERALTGAARRGRVRPLACEAVLRRAERAVAPGAYVACRRRGRPSRARRRGLLRAPEDGLAIEPLGLVAPFMASPVLRGEPRVRPGTPVPTRRPIALSDERGGRARHGARDRGRPRLGARPRRRAGRVVEGADALPVLGGPGPSLD